MEAASEFRDWPRGAGGFMDCLVLASFYRAWFSVWIDLLGAVRAVVSWWDFLGWHDRAVLGPFGIVGCVV
jgi:hypothetical protein